MPVGGGGGGGGGGSHSPAERLDGGRLPESTACCAPAWMLYMASYACGPSSSSVRVGLKTNPTLQSIHPDVLLNLYRDVPDDLVLLEAELCACSVDRGRGCACRATAGFSPAGGAATGGRMGREVGIMYSDSSSLSRAFPEIRTGEGLRTKPGHEVDVAPAFWVDSSPPTYLMARE